MQERAVNLHLQVSYPRMTAWTGGPMVGAKRVLLLSINVESFTVRKMCSQHQKQLRKCQGDT